ncbi:MAG: hypothetical protein IJE78_00445 [Bacteroidaceae bacterium]|nr:hypothetical protein [Bacteroidaceae bacterium]MBQ2855582.1 hypothetical protein [Bacteroidaceae bacterium]
MKVGKIVNAFRALEKATVSDLTAEERISVVKAMKVMRTTAKDFESFVEDLREKFKSENLEAIIRKIQEGKGLTEDEVKTFNEYNIPVSAAIREEEDKEVELDIPKVSEDAIVKMIGENKWSLSKLETFDFMTT